ncbi:MAG: hypothetical protein RSF40_02050 [Oscillospiraceae bacterium]
MIEIEDVKYSIEFLRRRKKMADDCIKHFMYGERQAVNIALKALQKQVPKKVVNFTELLTDGETQYQFDRCPVCNHCLIEGLDLNYCTECGQKLDWNVEDEAN